MSTFSQFFNAPTIDIEGKTQLKTQDLLYFREDQIVARELLVLIRSKNVKS